MACHHSKNKHFLEMYKSVLSTGVFLLNEMYWVLQIVELKEISEIFFAKENN